MLLHCVAGAGVANAPAWPLAMTAAPSRVVAKGIEGWSEQLRSYLGVVPRATAGGPDCCPLHPSWWHPIPCNVFLLHIARTFFLILCVCICVCTLPNFNVKSPDLQVKTCTELLTVSDPSFLVCDVVV